MVKQERKTLRSGDDDPGGIKLIKGDEVFQESREMALFSVNSLPAQHTRMKAGCLSRESLLVEMAQIAWNIRSPLGPF